MHRLAVGILNHDPAALRGLLLTLVGLTTHAALILFLCLHLKLLHALVDLHTDLCQNPLPLIIRALYLSSLAGGRGSGWTTGGLLLADLLDADGG